MIRKVILLLVCMATANWASAIVSIPPDLYAELQENKKQVEQCPSDSAKLFQYAIACAYTGRVDEGVKALKKIDQIDKEYGKKITPIYKEAVAQNPGDWRDRFHYAFAVYSLTIEWKKKGLTREEADTYKAEAFAQFEKVIGILGEKHFVSAWAYGYMALILGEQEKYKEGIELLHKALKIVPDGIPLHEALGFGYLKTNNYLGLTGELLKVGRLMSQEQGKKGKIVDEKAFR